MSREHTYYGWLVDMERRALNMLWALPYESDIELGEAGWNPAGAATVITAHKHLLDAIRKALKTERERVLTEAEGTLTDRREKPWRPEPFGNVRVRPGEEGC